MPKCPDCKINDLKELKPSRFSARCRECAYEIVGLYRAKILIQKEIDKRMGLVYKNRPHA